MNYDGRLNAREIILGSIRVNRVLLGTTICENCYSNSTKIIDEIFIYLDCNNDGFLTAEEMWGNLNNLERYTIKYNIYAFGVCENIRTAAVNDFILKNSKSKEAAVTREEFKQGILLGYWDRQTEKTGILIDDRRTMKEFRWREDGTVDIALYNYYKRRMISQLKSQQENQ